MIRAVSVAAALSGVLLACNGGTSGTSSRGQGGAGVGGTVAVGGTSGAPNLGGAAGTTVIGTAGTGGTYGGGGTSSGGSGAMGGAGGSGGGDTAKDASADRADPPDGVSGDATGGRGGASGAGGAMPTGGAAGGSGACGNSTLDVGEGCDDGNQSDGDGCSHACAVEDGFVCDTVGPQTCQSGSGQCLRLPVIYRDFQPENTPEGGHPDFHFLGSKWNGSKSPTTICVPNSVGPARATYDATARCWGIAADKLVDGKPRMGNTTTCACQFSDWSVYNDTRIQGGYSLTGSDSPLSDGNGGYLGGTPGAVVTVVGASGTSTGKILASSVSSPTIPVWQGTVPSVKDAASFAQWFSDDAAVNRTFSDVFELKQIGSGTIFQHTSSTHLTAGGFFPLDALHPAQKTLCNLFPYWNHGNGKPIWATCQGDQYLFSPRASASDCMTGDMLDDGCWVLDMAGQTHDYYFTSEIRQTFVYDGASGLQLQAYVDGDLWAYIDGQLVLDLGGTHEQLPGKVTVAGDPAAASIVEGGCLDSAGNIIGSTAGSTACSQRSASSPPAKDPDDYRNRTVQLGLVTGKTYELAIFHANRTPVESNLQLSLTGLTGIATRSVCRPR
jgi:cysteine-rich repeat protein